MSGPSRKPIEQVVSELGRYPLEAFLFIQDCLGAASEQVHGPMSQAEETVAKWMANDGVDLDELRRRSGAGDLPSEIDKALQTAGGPDRLNRHVTGQQLCWAVRDVALKRWGLMARSVLARWNIKRTEDIGAIIFALVNNDWLQKQPADRLEDFDHVFTFDQAFDGSYQFD